MDRINEKVGITEADIDEMSQLAEEVMDELHFYYQGFDDDGRIILDKYRELYSLRLYDYIKKMEAISKEEPNACLLFNLFQRGDDYHHVKRYTKADIIP